MVNRSTETDRSDPCGIDDPFFRQLLHHALEARNLIRAFLYAAVALTVDLLWGYTGILTFGQSAFFGIGAYAAGLIFTHVGFSLPFAAAALVFVGEAPGHDEDLQGEPFVGAAGQLLNRIIAAIGLRREQVYMLNVIKCRPPQNRNPQPDEIAACWPILQEQLAYLRPRIICALGAFAAQTLLQTEERISRLRGRFHRFGDIQVMPTYHPAFLLRNSQYKRAVWEDMQLVQRALGLQ